MDKQYSVRTASVILAHFLCYPELGLKTSVVSVNRGRNAGQSLPPYIVAYFLSVRPKNTPILSIYSLLLFLY